MCTQRAMEGRLDLPLEIRELLLDPLESHGDCVLS